MAYNSLSELFTATADAIRGKTGGTDPIVANDFPIAISEIQMGAVSVEEKDINFMDYDGTLLHSYSIDEFANMTELPPLPEQEGLICQGWNWNLEDIKAMGRAVDVGATYITDDGKTRLYIHLEEGRTSPMVGMFINGTVIVDWGDGTEPDIITGTSLSTVKYTPNHEYATAGDYVISLDVNGTVYFGGKYGEKNWSYLLRHSSAEDGRNNVYQRTLQKAEIGSGVSTIKDYAFRNCPNLKNITIPNDVTAISASYALSQSGLAAVVIPNSVTTLGTGAFSTCKSLTRVSIPNSITSIGMEIFPNCNNITRLVIPNSLTDINNQFAAGCHGLTSIILPAGVTRVGNTTFSGCYGMRYYDFTQSTAVPTVGSSFVFQEIPKDCEIRVPAALYDEWINSTNWATYADYIVGV